jgi:hypothetical protein
VELLNYYLLAVAEVVAKARPMWCMTAVEGVVLAVCYITPITPLLPVKNIQSILVVVAMARLLPPLKDRTEEIRVLVV